MKSFLLLIYDNMNKLLTSLICTGVLLSWKELMPNTDIILDTRTTFTKDETNLLINKILNENKIINIRWVNLHNPGWKFNNDIRNTIISVAKVIDDYIPKNISVKWEASTNSWNNPVWIQNSWWNSLKMYYKYRF